MENALFIVDRAQLKSANDWLVSDVGSYLVLKSIQSEMAKLLRVKSGLIKDSKTWWWKMASIGFKMCSTQTKNTETF